MNISIIGAGAVGGAIALGLNEAGINASDITISNHTPNKLEKFKAAGMKVTTDNKECCKGADMIFICVKPWILEGVVKEIRDFLNYDKQAVSVIVAGVSCSQLKDWFTLGLRTPVLSLSMPNTAVGCRKSMTFVVPISGDENNPDVALFKLLGEVKVIEERLLGAATALASSGIAFALRYIRAATEGGVQLGFRAADAQAIVAQTVKGAAALLEEGAHAEAEIDKVTTAGGVTIRGLNAMEKEGFSFAVIEGLLNAR